MLKRIYRIKEKIAPKDSFRENTLTLMTGTGFAQLIPIAITPILTRLYSPSDFGMFAVCLFLISIATVLATGKYEYAVIIAKNDKEALQVLFLVILLLSAICLLFVIGIFLSGNFIPSMLNLSANKTIIYLLPAGILLTGVYQVLNNWFIRKKKFKKMAIRRVIQYGSMAFFQIIFGLRSLELTGLLLGYIIGQIIGYGFFAWEVYRENVSEIMSIRLINLVEQARRYRNFLIFTVPSSLCSTMSSQSPSFFLNILFNPTIVGYYDLPRRLLSVPATLISSSILDVFQERASKEYIKYGSCKEIFIKTLKTLTMLAIIPYLIAFIFSPKLIPIIFGANWQIAGQYARYLSIYGFMLFIASPLGYVLLIAEKQFVNFIWQLIFLLVNICSLFIGYFFNSAIISIICFSLVNSIMCILYILISYYFTDSKRGHATI